MSIRQQAQSRAYQEYYNQNQVQLFHQRICQERKKLKKLEETICQLKKDLEEEKGFNSEKQLFTKGLQLKLDGLKQNKNMTEVQCMRLKEDINYIRKEQQLVKQQYSKIVNDIHSQQSCLKVILEKSNLARQYILEGCSELKYTDSELTQQKKNFENYFSQEPQKFQQFPINKETLTPIRQQNFSFNYLEVSKLQAEIDEQEQSIQNILKECSCSTMDEAIQAFYEVEEQNYKMFNELNELMNEETFLNDLENKLLQLDPNTRLQERQPTQSFVHQIKNLKDKKKKIEVKMNFQEAKWFRFKTKIEQIRDLIYDACEQQNIPLSEPKEEIKFRNLEKWLSLIEKTLNDLYLKKEQQEQTTKKVAIVSSNQSSERYIPLIKQKAHRKIDNYQLKAQEFEKQVKFDNNSFISYDKFKEGIQKIVH